MPKTLVIVPAYNEEAALPGVLADLYRHAPDVDVLVIDDGSSDATADVARAYGAHCAKLPFNLGIGGALRTGFRYAQRNGYQRALQFDADGQHKASEISKLMAKLDGGANIAIGSRFLDQSAHDDGTRYKVGFLRGTAMALLRSMVSFFAGQKLTDTSSGFRAFDHQAVDLFAREYPRDYLGDTVEALILARYAGLTIAETRTAMRERTAGEASQPSLRLAYQYIRLLVMLLATMSLSGRRAPRVQTKVPVA